MDLLVLADRFCFSRFHDDKTSGRDLDLIGMIASSIPDQSWNNKQGEPKEGPPDLPEVSNYFFDV